MKRIFTVSWGLFSIIVIIGLVLVLPRLNRPLVGVDDDQNLELLTQLCTNSQLYKLPNIFCTFILSSETILRLLPLTIYLLVTSGVFWVGKKIANSWVGFTSSLFLYTLPLFLHRSTTLSSHQAAIYPTPIFFWIGLGVWILHLGNYWWQHDRLTRKQLIFIAILIILATGQIGLGGKYPDLISWLWLPLLCMATASSLYTIMLAFTRSQLSTVIFLMGSYCLLAYNSLDKYTGLFQQQPFYESYRFSQIINKELRAQGRVMFETTQLINNPILKYYTHRDILAADFSQQVWEKQGDAIINYYPLLIVDNLSPVPGYLHGRYTLIPVAAFGEYTCYQVQ